MAAQDIASATNNGYAIRRDSESGIPLLPYENDGEIFTPRDEKNGAQLLRFATEGAPIPTSFVDRFTKLSTLDKNGDYERRSYRAHAFLVAAGLPDSESAELYCQLSSALLYNKRDSSGLCTNYDAVVGYTHKAKNYLLTQESSALKMLLELAQKQLHIDQRGDHR